MRAIEVQGMKKVFGEVRALDGLDFYVEEGSVYGFLGPNGAGKTTTLRILAGLAIPSAGQAKIQGIAVGPESPTRGLVGYLPEEPSFYPWMTAREFLVDLVGGLHGLPRPSAAERGEDVLSLVGLGDVANRRVGGFSKGMRQRLGLAQALLCRPPILLLDEPVSALDPVGRHDVLALVESLKGETTVLMSTHILGDVERICDRIAIIDRGRVIVSGERLDLLSRFAAPVVEVCFDASDDEVLNWSQTALDLRFVGEVEVRGKCVRIGLDEGVDGYVELQRNVLDSGLLLSSYRKVQPQLEDLFLKLVGER